MSNSVLLTGGFGNIGGRLAAHLSNSKDIELRLGSRSIRPIPQWAPLATTTQLDLLDVSSIESAVSGIDTIIHLAALNDIECARDPILAHEVNVEGTRSLVDCATRAGVLRFIYLSTAQVYGSPLEGRIDESHPTLPAHTYAATHLAAEKVVAESHESDQIIGLRIRSANGFGAPMDPQVKIWQILVNDLCRQAVEKRHLTLKTYGDQERNFLPLTDVCNAIVHLMRLESNRVGPGLFNLGADKSHSIWEMANRIAGRAEQILGFKPPITRPQKTDESRPIHLDYRSDRLKNTGLAINAIFDSEIDELLMFCKREFGK